MRSDEDNGGEDNGGSDPCFAHMLVGGHVVDPQTWADVSTFRTAQRERLYAARKGVRQAERAAIDAAIATGLDAVIGDPRGKTIAAYWPIRGEPDLRGWMTDAHSAGARIALPVVMEKNHPVEFREWVPKCQMVRGVWNIPVPADGKAVTPDIVIAPLLGVDDENFRLGNGGGYYDMTLAQMQPAPLVVGTGHAFAAMKTIYPMPWDIRMNIVVLSDGTIRPRQKTA